MCRQNVKAILFKIVFNTYIAVAQVRLPLHIQNYQQHWCLPLGMQSLVQKYLRKIHSHVYTHFDELNPQSKYFLLATLINRKQSKHMYTFCSARSEISVLVEFISHGFVSQYDFSAIYTTEYMELISFSFQQGTGIHTMPFQEM